MVASAWKGCHQRGTNLAFVLHSQQPQVQFQTFKKKFGNISHMDLLTALLGAEAQKCQSGPSSTRMWQSGATKKVASKWETALPCAKRIEDDSCELMTYCH